MAARVGERDIGSVTGLLLDTTVKKSDFKSTSAGNARLTQPWQDVPALN